MYQVVARLLSPPSPASALGGVSGRVSSGAVAAALPARHHWHNFVAPRATRDAQLQGLRDDGGTRIGTGACQRAGAAARAARARGGAARGGGRYAARRACRLGCERRAARGDPRGCLARGGAERRQHALLVTQDTRPTVGRPVAAGHFLCARLRARPAAHRSELRPIPRAPSRVSAMCGRNEYHIRVWAARVRLG